MSRIILILIIMQSYDICAQSQINQTTSKTQKTNPIKISGSVSLFSNLYASSDSNTRINPLTYGISISPVIKTYNYTFPFSFTYSNGRSALSQPFVRFGVAPSYKGAKFYLGNNTMNFSRFAFNGLNCFGVGAEINVKGLLIGAFSGQLSRKFTIDSSSQSFKTVAQRYESRGTAIKAGIKTKSTRILFTYLTAQDVPSSLSYTNPLLKNSPRRNKALGSEVFFRIGRNISITSLGGMTIMTRNQNAFDIDTLLRNSGEKELPAYTKFLEKSPNISTFLAFAFENQLSFNFKKFGLDIKQKRIEPDYQTIGQRFENNDILQYTIDPHFKLMNNRLLINLSGGIQRNNLSHKKTTQQNNKIYSGNLSFIPSNKFFMNVNYSNYGVLFGSSKLQIDDSISIKNINQNLSINSVYYLINNQGGSKSISLNYNRSNTTETYEFNPLNNSDFNNSYLNLTYVASIKNGLAYSAGLNYNNSTSQIFQLIDKLYEIQSYGIHANITKPLMAKRHLIMRVGGNLNLAGELTEDKRMAFGLNGSFSYQLSNKSTLILGGNYSQMSIANRNINQRNAYINFQNSL